MTRVDANLAWLVPGRVGGSEEYTVRLLCAAAESRPADIDLRLIGSSALFAAHPELAEIEHVVLGGPVRFRPWRVASESTSVFRLTRTADVVHHFGGRVPARHHGNDVVTIHDLQPLQMPENFSLVKRRYLAVALPRSVATARLVVTPSEWVASTVVDVLGADPSRLRAVSSTWDVSTEIDPTLASSLGEGPVVLYPAITHPHKRHLLLLDAIGRLADAHPRVTVVLTGGEGRAEDEVREAVARSAVRVVRPGRVTAASLRGLYERADLLVFPSAYEGFGLPVLEAMRIGLPVVASDQTALPEVLGDTGTLVAGDDPAVWAAAIADALVDGRERSAGAPARAERWSPTRAAARLVAAWRSVV
ncbi:MAG: glycosyltransferase family 1 protein [Acidimicrobiales bacterium]